MRGSGLARKATGKKICAIVSFKSINNVKPHRLPGGPPPSIAALIMYRDLIASAVYSSTWRQG